VINLSVQPYQAIFRSDLWAKSSAEERLDSLQMLENQAAEAESRESRRIMPTFYEDDSVMGCYSPNKPDEIQLNTKLLFPEYDETMDDSNYNAVNTVFHEGYHAYQNDAVDGLAEAQDEEECTKWQENREPGVYFNPQKGAPYEIYTSQPLERDAKSFANEQTDQLMTDIGEPSGPDTKFARYQKNQEYDQRMTEQYLMDAYAADSPESAISELDDEVHQRYEAVQAKSQDSEQENQQPDPAAPEEEQDRDQDNDRGYC